MKKVICTLIVLMLVFSLLGLCSAESTEEIPVKAIKLESNNISLLIGASEDAARGQIKLIVTPENTTTTSFSFESNNESVVTVDQEGNLQAVGVGKAKVTIVPKEDKPKAKAICSVSVGQAVTKIKIPASQTIHKTKTFSIKPTVEPKEATSKNVIYSSSNENVATVNKQGVVKGLKCGNATITCTAADGSGVSATCEITVIQPVSKVSSSTKRMVMFRGDTKYWRVYAEPSDATNKKLNYSSSAWNVSIDSNGEVTGKSAGKAKITATSTDGSKKSCTCDVIVEPSVPLSLDSIGYGIYMYNMMAMTVTNKCSTLTVVDYDFDLAFYDYSGSMINGGSYSLGKEERIGPGRQKTIKRTIYGVGQAYKTVVTITGVKFSDGSYWSIPSSEQETWSFTRN